MKLKGKLVVIVGPTASGKSDLAFAIAKKYGGEIIAADSRTVYRYMDIGTAKPTNKEMLQIPHHLVNIKDPNEPFSVAEFKELAESVIKKIWLKQALPLLVGGTGLYVNSVIYNYQFPVGVNSESRQELEKLSDEELSKRLKASDPAAYEQVDLNNRRRIIRAIETAGQERGRSQDLDPNILLLGIAMDKKVIQERIEARIEKMLEKGFLDEVRLVGEKFGWESEAMSGIGYRAFKDVILGTKTIDEAGAEFVRGDMMLVKKQMTWFKRDKNIKWIHSPGEGLNLVENFLRGDV